jgi:hypothetical protein
MPLEIVVAVVVDAGEHGDTDKFGVFGEVDGD